MAKKVIGILLILMSSMFLFMGVLFGVVFGGFGALFGIVNNQEMVVGEDGTIEETVGEIVAVYGSETVIFYEVDGEEYMNFLNVSSTSYPVGTLVTVEYDTSDPMNIQVPELTEEVFGLLGGIFGGFGIAFAVIFGLLGAAGLVGGILLLKSYKKSVAIPQI